MVSAAAAAGDAKARVMQLHLMDTSLTVPCCSDRVKVRHSSLVTGHVRAVSAPARPAVSEPLPLL